MLLEETGAQAATYNTLNQLTVLSGQARTYDAIGNLTSDGTRTYTWDAESRLVGIGYPGQPGKASAFTYDGLGRRTAIAETPPGGGAAVTTSYLWCDDAICQARDGSNARTRSYYDEGEIVPGSPAQPYYYGVDQLGSVRRAFATTSSAPAYAYDPYGVPLQVTAPVTDFGYAGLFNHPASGLNLTLYRGYDPVAGRWLSRDPLGEESDPYGNLYAYVAGNTPNAIDPLGLMELYREFGVTMHSYPGPAVRGDEHARQGPGGQYHIHLKDREGREARISTENWKPLTPADQRTYNQSPAMQRMCENLSEGQKKFLDRVNRQIFHRGQPTARQLEGIGNLRGSGGRGGRGDP